MCLCFFHVALRDGAHLTFNAFAAFLRYVYDKIRGYATGGRAFTTLTCRGAKVKCHKHVSVEKRRKLAMVDARSEEDRMNTQDDFN